MRTLEEIKKANRSGDSLVYKTIMSVQMTSEQYEAGRKEYEEFVKPTVQRVFARHLVKETLSFLRGRGCPFQRFGGALRLVQERSDEKCI